MAFIDAILQKGYNSYQNYHLTKMAPHKNGISKLLLLVFSSTSNTMLINPTPTLDTTWKNLILKSHNHGSESYYKFINSFKKSLSSAFGMWPSGIFSQGVQFF